MKAIFTFITVLFAISACGMKQAKQDSIIDTAIQAEDNIGTRKALNDIRFEGWKEANPDVAIGSCLIVTATI